MNEFRRFARIHRSEPALALATTIAVPAISVRYGVLVVVGLSILDRLRRVRHPHDGILGFAPGCTTWTATRPRRPCRGSSATGTTRRCVSPTPRTSGAVHSPRWTPPHRRLDGLLLNTG
ncbi:hypothetical protein [Pseudonocardia alaniniphila]|uniref:Uncharacterized protein n=1 Tax=Pseudonocardia alaniniphila TaxID=75291 RepID=A0ABS9TAZ8_9PSEU|nr:hypothetical protein [Pseudonocardia alaniniphila]MCH6165709.1 hypothetical protein [Pseudonocardia alaniniphila]